MKNRSGEKIKLASIDELLGVVNEESAMEIEISKIHPFKNHPFKVLDDEKMQDLVESVKINGVLTPVLLRILDFFICFHDSIWNSKCSMTGIIAVLQRCTHVLYFVLMPCDLCQEASACTNNSHGNDHEFLYCWMGKSCNVFYGLLTVGLMVKIHQICHVLDRMTVLCEPGSKDHILFCFPDSIAV